MKSNTEGWVCYRGQWCHHWLTQLDLTPLARPSGLTETLPCPSASVITWSVFWAVTDWDTDTNSQSVTHSQSDSQSDTGVSNANGLEVTVAPTMLKGQKPTAEAQITSYWHLVADCLKANFGPQTGSLRPLVVIIWRKSHRVCCLLYLYSRVRNGPERTDHRQRHWTYCHKYRCRYQGDHHHIYHGCCRGRQSHLDTLETDRKTCMNWVECSWRLKFNVRLPRSSHQGSPAHKNHGNTWASRSCRCRRWDSRCSWPQTRWEGHISQPPGHRRRPEERAAREWTWRDTGRQVLRRDDRTFSVALGGHLEAGDLHGPQLIYSRERTSFNKKKKVWHPQGGAAVIKVLPEDQRLTAHRIVRQGWVRSAGSRCRRRFRR